jgi:hypothetical protein
VVNVLSLVHGVQSAENKPPAQAAPFSYHVAFGSVSVSAYDVSAALPAFSPTSTHPTNGIVSVPVGSA